tara:strand:- start:1057 stop:2049 length:993 start_codon:yes stop_codon:yes gene_type:complete
MKKKGNKSSWKSILFLFNEVGKLGEGEGYGDFKLSKFIRGFFKEKSENEIENSLIVGTKYTTPLISEISLNYPEPWLFGRLLFGSIFIFYSFVALYQQFEVSNLIPAIILIGSFGVPISTLFLFFEFNIARNVPIWNVMKLVFTGGLLSIFITIVLSKNIYTYGGPSGAWFAAFIEEPAKLITVLMLVKNKKKYPYILNGLLFGSAVGAGFAAFESAGYALNYGLKNLNSLIGIIQLRGILSPFGHVAWTAIAGAAFWRVSKDGKFKYKLFMQRKFYIPFITIIFLHAIWNSGSVIPFRGLYFILASVVSAMVLAMVNLGIKQIALEKQK